MKLKHLYLFPLLLAPLAYSQMGDISDKPGVVQTPLIPKDKIPPSPVLTPEEQIKSFKVAPGFHVELVAGDPMVQDPVAIAFDADGKLWVTEMRGYMNTLEGAGEDQPIGRVVVLRDTNGDGRMDKRTVFLDNLVMPRAVMPVAGGALVGAPPKLWFCREGPDGKCAEKIDVATDYGMAVDPKRPMLANPQRAPNCLLWNIDNWIYSAVYIMRFRFADGEWQKSPTIFRGQYGLTQDDVGRLFYNSNSDQLRVDIIPSQYIGRNPNYPRAAGVNVQTCADQFTYPARVNTGVNRGYKRATLWEDGRLREYTACCGPLIYRGDMFPADCYGNAFICEPAGNFIRRNRLFEHNGTLTATNAYDHAEFLGSTDERFRPVNLANGPDGALYICDFHHGVLEARISITSYLRKQIEDRHLDKPLHLGRIFRVVPDGQRGGKSSPQMSRETPLQLVEHLSNPNGWWRDTAQRLIVERMDGVVLPALQKLAATGQNPLGRLHALWTLDGLNQVDLVTLDAGLADKDSRVRSAAIRISERFFRGNDKAAVLRKLIALTGDTSPDVQLQLALSLGEARDVEADYAMAKLARDWQANAYLYDAVVTGLYMRELELLERLLHDPEWRSTDPKSIRLLRGLPGCVFASRKGERVNHLLELIVAEPSAAQAILLEGALARASKKPAKLPSAPAALAVLQKSDNKVVRNAAAKIDSHIVWPGKPGVPPEPVVPPLTTAQQARFESGKELFTKTCANCHQLHGLGMDGMAPPLMDSEWVNGSEQRLVRIALNGLHGKIRVIDRDWTLDMPSFATLDDEQIASILTYVRREWEQTSPPVEPATVKAIRAANAKRDEAWSQEELLAIP